MESNQEERWFLRATTGGRATASKACGSSEPSGFALSRAELRFQATTGDSVAPSGFSGGSTDYAASNLGSLECPGRTAVGGGAATFSSSSPSQSFSPCFADLPRRHHPSIKSARPGISTTHQVSRHSALLRIRRSDRDKAVASRRRQFMPLNAPPLPQPIIPLIGQLDRLLPLASLQQVGEVKVEPTSAHQEALRLLKLIHELIACYPNLLEDGSPLPGHSHLVGVASPPCDKSSSVLLLVHPTCAIVSSAVEGAVSPFAPVSLVEFCLRLLQHACGCIAAAVAARPLPQEAVPVWLPLLLSLLQTVLTKSSVAVERSEGKGTVIALARQVRQEVLFALGNVAADFQDTVCGAGGISSAVDAMRQALVELDVGSTAQPTASNASSYAPAWPSATCLRTAAWFLANLLRPPLHLPAVLKPMLAGTAVSCGVFDRTSEGDGPMCASPSVSSRPLVGGLQVLTELLRSEVEKQHAALRLSATDDRRAALGEALWCLVLFLESVFCARPSLPPPCPSSRVGSDVACALGGGGGPRSDRMTADVASSISVQGSMQASRIPTHSPSCSKSDIEVQSAGDRKCGTTGESQDATAFVLTAAEAENASVEALKETSPDLVLLLVRIVFEGFQGVLLQREREAVLGKGEGSPDAQFSTNFFKGAEHNSANTTVRSTPFSGRTLAEDGNIVTEQTNKQFPEHGGDNIDATTADLQIDGERERLKRFNGNGADILVPALKLLNLFCACLPLADTWADDMISAGGEDFQRLLVKLLQQKDVMHRGVLCATLSFVACMAAGASQRTDYVVALIKPAAEILNSAEPYDIRREAAVYLLHMALNHGKRHLDKVVGAEPSVIQGMLDILEQNKYDRASVMIALDFLRGVLDARPSSRMDVYRRDGIAKIESAQFLHDPAVDDLISWMVSHYFDDFNEAEEDDEEAVERVAAQDFRLAGQLNGILDFST
ncbi:hypothetical protein CSUI_005960 [Cystoisospora suis]|uniref:Uncharacterized protein n=1 Tax=Cystoisospora suis TaxID=483139 RepID=A0A2C6KW50_9APIC|nr:hypothetical protein CSUI_005960 [Cystoisospora suis]